MDHSLHPRLLPEELNFHNLEGAKIYDRNDDIVGSISQMRGEGEAAQVIVDVGGFLGIGVKHVALPLPQLDVMRDDHDVVHAVTEMSRQEVEALPGL